MAITIDGALDELVKLLGELPSARERRWLWLNLKFFKHGPPNQFSQFYNAAVQEVINSHGQFLGGDIEFELVNLLELNSSFVPAMRLGRFFAQLESFDWIDGGDVRQLLWLTDHIHGGLNFEVPEARARLSARDYFICLVDLVALPVLDKEKYLSSLHQLWVAHLKNTSYLNWLSDDDESGRCDFAWQVFESRLESTLSNSLQAFVGQEFRKYKGSVGLKSYFDSLHVSDFEKKSHVDYVKKLWSQRKYREKLEKNKLRQRNFVLPDKTIKSLDKLANELGVSRTEALERLIELSAKHGISHTSKD